MYACVTRTFKARACELVMPPHTPSVSQSNHGIENILYAHAQIGRARVRELRRGEPRYGIGYEDGRLGVTRRWTSARRGSGLTDEELEVYWHKSRGTSSEDGHHPPVSIRTRPDSGQPSRSPQT